MIVTSDDGTCWCTMVLEIWIRLDRSGGERAGGFRRAAAFHRREVTSRVFYLGGDINPAPL